MGAVHFGVQGMHMSATLCRGEAGLIAHDRDVCMLQAIRPRALDRAGALRARTREQPGNNQPSRDPY